MVETFFIRFDVSFSHAVSESTCVGKLGKQWNETYTIGLEYAKESFSKLAA